VIKIFYIVSRRRPFLAFGGYNNKKFKFDYSYICKNKNMNWDNCLYLVFTAFILRRFA